MDIVFNCDKCGQSLTIDEAGAGLVLQCPSCGKEITIPPKSVWFRAVNDVLRKNVQMILEGRNNPGEARLAINRVLDATNYRAPAGKEGTIQDLRSFQRQNILINTNTAIARGYGQAQLNNDPDVVDEYPALELVRVGFRKHHRGDPIYPETSDGSIGWEDRWAEAADDSGDEGAARVFEKTGRMVALRSSDIWDSLGNLWDDSLGNPFPPFAFDSSMDTFAVNREETESLGLLDKGEKAKGMRLPNFSDSFEQTSGNEHKFIRDMLLWLQHRFIPIDDERVTKWLWGQPKECGHCGEEKPRTVLTVCDNCKETVCPDCKAKGCTGSFQLEE